MRLVVDHQEVVDLAAQTRALIGDFGNLALAMDNIVAGSLSSFANGFTDAFTAIATGSNRNNHGF